MKLTEKEIKHLENINKNQRNLYRMRHYFLSVGVILIGLGLVPTIFFWLQGNMVQVNKFTSHPSFYLLPISGGIAIGYAIQGWKGNSVYILLSRVVEELREK